MDEIQRLMQAAIDKAEEGIAAGQTPFGCAIAKDGQLLAVEHNTVLLTTDVSAHAEVNAIRAACLQLGSIHLDGCLVATTCEPCPMCAAALHWARVEHIYYGATIADARKAGFNELGVAAEDLLKRGGSRVGLTADVRRAECQALFNSWIARPDRQAY